MLARRVGTRVLRLVEAWVPAGVFGTRADYRGDLSEYLEEHLNNRDKAMFGRVRAYDVRESYGESGPDVSVDGTVGIVLEHDVASDRIGQLRHRILDSRDEYPLLVVCACGFEETDGWNALKRECEGTGAGVESTIRFVEKFKDSRTFRGGGDGWDGGFSGGGGELDLGIRRLSGGPIDG